MKKVDFVVPHGGIGGVEMVLNQLALYLMSQGIQVRVVEMVWSGTPWLDPKIAFYPLRRDRVEHVDQFAELYGMFMRQQGAPDVAVALPWPLMGFQVKKALKYAGVDERCKLITWLHAPLQVYKENDVGGAEYLAFSDRVFCLTENEAAQINQVLGRSTAVKVYNPIDFSKCTTKHFVEMHTDGRDGADKQHMVQRCALYVGRFSEEKNVDIIIKGIAQTETEWKLILVGDGPERQKLETLVQEKGLEDRVTWLGWQENPWKAVDVQWIDFLVMASSYEGFGLVAMEALASGIPVIATPVEGVTEFLKIGVTGYFYPQGHPEALAEVLDAVAYGTLPAGDMAACVETSKPYEMQRALEDLKQKLFS